MGRPRKSEEVFEGHEDLPDLTDKQYSFVIFMAEGCSGAEAYRRAYDTESQSPTAIGVRAAEVKTSRNVAVWLNVVHQARIKRGLRSIDDHLDRLTDLSVKAENSGNYGAAVTAEVAAGKASGLYELKVAIEDRTAENLKRDLAEILGLEPRQLEHVANEPELEQ